MANAYNSRQNQRYKGRPSQNIDNPSEQDDELLRQLTPINNNYDINKDQNKAVLGRNK